MKVKLCWFAKGNCRNVQCYAKWLECGDDPSPCSLCFNFKFVHCFSKMGSSPQKKMYDGDDGDGDADDDDDDKPSVVDGLALSC